MNFKLRTYLTDRPTIAILLVVLMILIGLLDYYKMITIWNYVTVSEESMKPDFEWLKIPVFAVPVLSVGFLFLILKFTPLNRPLVISAIVGSVVITCVTLIALVTDVNFPEETLITYFLAVLGLILVWIIMVQTNDKTSMAFSYGIFVYLSTIEISKFMLNMINHGYLNILGAGILISIAAMISSIFQVTLKTAFRVLRVPLK
ncbi:MAG: hypothetical protein NXI20_00660 [bacterium]|nr:hypothetical protein [bacterium]